MTPEIMRIKLPLPLNISQVNSYLIKNDVGFYLIDTGMTNARSKITAELERAGCQPGALKLIMLTHGDFDHTGNAAYLRSKFQTKIAMHQGDEGMLTKGDMFWNRKFEGRWVRRLASRIIRLGDKDRCTPDILLNDGDSLALYGLDGQVLNTPGHSTGSVCILTTSGDLFCGDLLSNARQKPELNSMMYDQVAGNHSLERLKSLPIQMVYPGHGAPFEMKALVSPS
jgi:hydroxyacylglutathione hydrolase